MAAILGGHGAIEGLLRAEHATAGEKDAELIKAAEKGDLARVTYLISAGVNPNARRRGESTALIRAIENGHPDVAHRLIGGGAKVNIKGREGRTALIAAASLNDPALVQALTAHDACQTIEAVDAGGRTATLATGSPEILRHLRDACGALGPNDDLYVTTQGDHYHREGCLVYQRFGGKSLQLRLALRRGLRPCSLCIQNQ
jgi:ankyrin repeat protein